ncbi:hypothetical protein WH96_01365 [Kiloniella spongiae]|uniref:Uncharacterized protein n=1 Tax=Kiloniella spongiae TaxID=1489064 RepID=A0A0H2MIH6_9PROT|nr:hypothetical protein [Kiloniella spongiae]KLN62203.1 hypothetical protein WH96_01365 [Kiloniella spongiae]
MSDLEELRTRVEAAEEHFGLIADQQKGYSQRLIALLNITEQKDQTIGKLEYENEQLRTMLFSLLKSIEKGDTTNTLQDMDVRISAMTSEAVEIEDKSTNADLSLPAPEEEVTNESEASDINEDAAELNSSDASESDDESDLDEIEELVADLEATDSDDGMTADEDDLSIDDSEGGTDDGATEISMDDAPESEDVPDSLESAADEVSTEDASETLEDIPEVALEDEAGDDLTDDDITGEDGIEEAELADVSEDDIIAEIADNLEEVLPAEDSHEQAPATEDTDSPLEGLEDPLEDQILSQDSTPEPAVAEDESDIEPEAVAQTAPDIGTPTEVEAEISAEEIPLSEDTDIDSFLDENADEEEKPASPEIEDIMERISKQALSQGE